MSLPRMNGSRGLFCHLPALALACGTVLWPMAAKAAETNYRAWISANGGTPTIAAGTSGTNWSADYGPANAFNGVGVAVTESGLKWTKDHVFFADPDDRRAAELLFRSAKRPDAIIAVNDFIASKLLKTLKAIGKRVPGDVLLAGVNGDLVAEESDPPVTTMAQPCERIGEAAVHLMSQRLGDFTLPPRAIMLSARLVARNSTQRNGK